MQNIKIRRYKPSDNPIVWKLHRLGLAEIGIKPDSVNPWEEDLNNIENIYLKGGDFIVGEYGGRVVAMGAFKKISDEVAELKRMRVHPDYQRRGFGQAIIDELEKRAKKMGYKRVILDTGQKNTKSNNFYKKNDYKETGRKIVHENYHAIFYEKEVK